MSFFDQLALHAAGAVGKYQQGNRAGEQERYKRGITAQDRQDDLERQALQQSIMQQRDAQAEAFRRDQLSQGEAYRRDTMERAAVDRGAAREQQAAIAREQIAARAEQGDKERAARADQARLVAALRPPKPEPIPKQPSESERRGAGLLTVLEPADQRVSKIEDGLTKGDIALTRGGIVGRFFQSPEAKQYDDDLKSLVSTYLYVVSGATASPKEVDNQVAMIRVNEADVGDAATIALKQKRRQEMMGAVRTIAGRAAPAALPGQQDQNNNDAALAQARRAIAGGKNKAAVAARYQQLTGKPFPE